MMQDLLSHPAETEAAKRKSYKAHEPAVTAFLRNPKARTLEIKGVSTAVAAHLVVRLSGHETIGDAGLTSVQSGDDVILVRRTWVAPAHALNAAWRLERLREAALAVVNAWLGGGTADEVAALTALAEELDANQ